MISGAEMTTALSSMGITHVVWLPDSTFGPWEAAFQATDAFRLLRVCREGEIWPLAAGLYLGGQSPLPMMQSTGFFESGDALRNAFFDLDLPLFACIGYRSYLIDGSPDTAKRFIEPILGAWGLNHVLIRDRDDLPKLEEYYRDCRSAARPGVALIAEGKM